MSIDSESRGIGPDGDDGEGQICPITGTYCTGQFCDDYGCAKEAGVEDDEFEGIQ